MVADFKLALRRLGQSPGFTAVALLTLAIGIGPAIVVFTAVNALFLRPITCLSEIAPEALIRAADETLFKGGLGPEPKLDLQMLLREPDDDPAQATLRQLTHDLAETFYAGISEEWQFPDVLRNVVCLVPAPAGYDEQLIVEWCV